MRFASTNMVMLGLFGLFLLGFYWLPEARWHKNLYYLCLVSAIPLFWSELGRWRDLQNSVLLAAFAYLAYQLLSLSWSPVASPEEWGELARKSVLTLSFVGLRAYGLRRTDLNSYAIMAVFGAITLAALLAIIGWANDMADAMNRLAVIGRAENANAAGALLGVASVLGFGFTLFATEKRKRIAFLLMWLICALGLLLTQSRGAWLSAAAAHAVLICLAPALSRKSVAMVSAAMLAVIVLGADAIDWQMIIARADGHRLELWQQALAGFEWFGHGYRTPFEAQLSYGETIYQVHSIYVKALYDGGVIGLGLLLAMWAMVAKTLWAHRHQTIGVIGLALLANAMVFGAVDFDILIVNAGIEWLLFWSPVAAALALSFEPAMKAHDENTA